MNLTIEEIKRDYTIAEYLSKQGNEVQDKTAKGEFVYFCPIHNDVNHPNLHVNNRNNTFYCHTCGGGGSVLDLVMQSKHLTLPNAIRHLTGQTKTPYTRPPEIKPKQALPINEDKKLQPTSINDAVEIYNYTDENNKYLYSKLKYEPKTFRQAVIKDGKLVSWSLKGIRKVLYNLQEVIGAETVLLCEGEKDAETLIDLGFVATTSPDGASSWRDGYSDMLAGRNVVIFPDHDEAGQKMLATVKASIADKAKSVKVIKFPCESTAKDITEYLESCECESKRLVVDLMINDADVYVKGYQMKSRSFAENLKEFNTRSEKTQFNLDLGEFHSGFIKLFRPIQPGELITIAAASGAGKTTVLSNLVLSIPDSMPVLFFQLELSLDLMISRISALVDNVPVSEIHRLRYNKEIPHKNISNLFFHYGSLVLESVKKEMNSIELVYGEKPKIIILDYANLMHTAGSEYESLTLLMKSLRRFAVDENVIVIIGCQLKKNETYGKAVSLTDVRGTGSIIDSSALILGCHQDEDNNLLVVDVLKATGGKKGRVFFETNFEKYKLTETFFQYTNPTSKDETDDDRIKRLLR